MDSYYIDILPGDISKSSPHKFDGNGVIMTKIPYNQDYHYHVTAIASQGIRLPMERIPFSNACSLVKIRTINDWLVNNITKEGTYVHDFILPFYDFKAPWVGGLAQGLAISSLIRVYNLTADKVYLNTAKKAFEGLGKHCVVTDKDNNYWITEYPGVPTILNGFIYALFGVYDIKKYIKEAEKLWNDCLLTLYKNLSKYDLNYWSRYDLVSGIPSTLFYHNIHIKQMRVLSELSDKYHDVFRLYERKWQHQFNHALPRLRSCMKRDKMIIKKHGLIGTYKRYNERRKWIN